MSETAASIKRIVVRNAGERGHPPTRRLFILPEECGFAPDDTDPISDEPHVYIEIRDRYLHLTSLYVPLRLRRQGMAGALMRAATGFHDDRFIHWPMYLSAHPYERGNGEPINQHDLFDFYTRFGFQRCEGHPFSMIRNP